MKKLISVFTILFALMGVAHAQPVGKLQTGQVWGNSLGSPATATGNLLGPLLDTGYTCSGQGSLLSRGASLWFCLAPGVSGKPLVSNGAANLSYSTLGVVGGGTNCAAASGTCLDNISGFSLTGFMNRTGAGTYTFSGATGTGSVVLQNSPSLVTPALGVATATSLAIGGATIGTNGLAVSGTNLFTTGSDNVQYLLVTGLGGNGRLIESIDSATSTVHFRSQNSFNLALGVNSADVLTIAAGGATLVQPLTYGGVALNNAVTGTGNMVLSTSPTLTTPALGTPSAVILTNGSGLPVAGLAAGTSDTVVGYFGSTVASALAINNCSNALTYNTSTHVFGCNTTAGTGTVTSVQLTGGTGISIATTSGANPCTSACNLTINSNNSMGANKYQVVITVGNGTITTPTGANWAKFILVGGGGGGSGGGTSAGTGVSGAATCISAGSPACNSPISSAGGGVAGNWSTGAGGAGGTTSGTCTSSIAGGAGGPTPPAATNGSGSAGGNSVYGGAGNGAFAAATAGAAATNSGSGGQGGGVSTSSSPGAGGGAGAYCMNFIQSPAASYNYTVGASGSGGTAGTSGAAGGAGGQGRLEVEFGFN